MVTNVDIATRIWVLNGTSGTGKDTFGEYACSILRENFSHSGSVISSVTKVKEASTLLGWDGRRDEKGREFLHRIKMLSSEFYDGAFHYMCEVAVERPTSVLFFMIREPEEITKFMQHMKGSKSILITRDLDHAYANFADQNVDNFNYDYVIHNDGTLLQLYDKAFQFVCDNVLKPKV